MATHWTYDATLFASTTAGYYPGSTQGERYQVRLLIRDIDSTRPLFQDEEIDWQLTQEANVYMVGAALCDMLISKGGGVRSKKVGELTITYDASFYRELSGQLRARGFGHQIPSAGGISVSDKLAQETDTDQTKGAIFRRLQDNPTAPQQATRTPTDPIEQI